jgi:phosphomannomutase/phosphoglucomutase
MGNGRGPGRVDVPLHVFREYDVRGNAERELTSDLARLLGRAFGELARARGCREVAVGRDNRLSSPRLRDAVVRGVGQAGLGVVDLGEVITPAFYFARVHYGLDAGVMITASHNPGDENGFKLALGPGTLYGEDVAALGRRVAELAASEPPPEAPGPVRAVDPREAYVAAIVERVSLNRPLRVAVDCGNGTASDLAPEVLRRLGCQVVPLFCVSDPRFPNHHPDPVRPENLRQLIAAVREQGCDLGLGVDGDGDRLGAVADDGRILWGDQLMILFWREILPRRPGATALVEVKCSQALVDEVERLGGRPRFHRTGHSYIKASLHASGAPFAGEMSGHLFFADEWFGFDDALYAGARLCRLVAASGQPLSALADSLPRYEATPEVRVACPDDRKFDVVAALRDRLGRRHPVVDVDGARVLFPDGWGLVRASNTQPALVARCEARTPEALRAICAEMERELSAFPEVGAVRWA